MGDPLDFISEDGWPYPDEDDDAEQLEPVDLRSDADDDLVALHALPPQALTLLSDVEREVVTARFGLDGQEPRTLRELHEQLGLSRERIRQALSDGLDKLRGVLDVDPRP
jgi:DNA-directed RNA polymerase sigma subunit (sigma70/sigma32)